MWSVGTEGGGRCSCGHRCRTRCDRTFERKNDGGAQCDEKRERDQPGRKRSCALFQCAKNIRTGEPTKQANRVVERKSRSGRWPPQKRERKRVQDRQNGDRKDKGSFPWPLAFGMN